MSELKCCPFCGGEARLYGNSKPIGTRLKHYQVAVCTNDDCGCRTSLCETVEDAIYKWNRRATKANIVEKLEYEKERHEKDRKYWSEKSWKDSCIYNECDMSNGKCECFEEAINIVKQEINNGLE